LHVVVYGSPLMSATGVDNHTAMPEGRDIALLSLGIIGIGTSGPVIALSAMPIPSLIFWRNLGGALTMLPFALRLREWRSAAGRTGLKYSVTAGALLAAHFLAFFGAMRLTSVATGTALTAMQPIFSALYAQFKGHSISKKAWSGMLIAFLSVIYISGIDLHLSLRAFTGDILAVFGAALAAAYMWFGSKAQRSLSTSTYTSTCYLTCALTALPVALIGRFPILGFAAREWWLALALIAGAQLLGHTMFNLSLKRVSPTVVSLVVFFEVPVSAILAYWWMGQRPPGGTIPGIIGLLVGSAIFVSRQG
jgi:drug/metabolite transporter (DMT)-like permease